MSLYKKLPPKKQLIANYVGGLGYYMFHVAWMIIFFLVCVEVIKAFVGTGYYYYAPSVATPSLDVSTVASAMWSLQLVVWIFNSIIVLALCVFVVLLPYWIGRISRAIPLSVLRQTRWRITLKSVLITKQLLVLLVFCTGFVALYTPSQLTTESASAFMSVVLLCTAASLLFWLQYMLTALWKIPQRSAV